MADSPAPNHPVGFPFGRSNSTIDQNVNVFCSRTHHLMHPPTPLTPAVETEALHTDENGALPDGLPSTATSLPAAPHLDCTLSPEPVGFAPFATMSNYTLPSPGVSPYHGPLRTDSSNAPFGARVRKSSSSASLGSLHGGSQTSINMMQAQDEELYHALKEEGPITIRRLQAALTAAGMHPSDPRLRLVHARLNSNPTETINFDQFKYIIESASLLIYRALSGNLVIPLWSPFISEIDALYKQAKTNNKGKLAQYIPELANANPAHWGVSFCSIDGQQHGVGDVHVPFSAQSCAKPVNYLIALELHGEEYVHRFVGREPSGRNFNELCLNSSNVPHNPMINAGAIMVCSLILHEHPASERFEYIMRTWRRLTGISNAAAMAKEEAGNAEKKQKKHGHQYQHQQHPMHDSIAAPGFPSGATGASYGTSSTAIPTGREVSFSNTVYLSEKSTANRNFCLAYLMQERQAFQYGAAPRTGPGALPPRTWSENDLESSLNLYFQCCSLEVTTSIMSVVAATLANGGVCRIVMGPSSFNAW